MKRRDKQRPILLIVTMTEFEPCNTNIHLWLGRAETSRDHQRPAGGVAVELMGGERAHLSLKGGLCPIVNVTEMSCQGVNPVRIKQKRMCEVSHSCG